MTGGHAFVRPGQVAPDLPAPDNCMVCGLTEAAHRSPADPRVTAARAFLAEAKQRKFADRPNSVLVREAAELRHQLGQVLKAISEGTEPEGGKLAAIRGVLDAFDWERGDRQYALERIEQIAEGSRTASGIEPDGTAVLTPADVQTVLSALRDAAENGVSCPDCDATPETPCDPCLARLREADEYDQLAARLGGES